MLVSPAADPVGAAIDKVEMERDLDRPVMHIVTGQMSAEIIETKDADGAVTMRRVLHMTASSTIEDLYGDTMDEQCVRGMSAQAMQKAMTIFLNHKYAIPEDAFGKVYSANVRTDTKNDEGADIWDLHLDVELAESNPRVGKTWQLIKDDGLKLGVSIGAMITDATPKDKDLGWWGPLTIHEVDLLEASVVGIPANQRSWVQYAASSPWLRSATKALRAFHGAESPTASLVSKGALTLDLITTTSTTNSTETVLDNITVGTTTTGISTPAEPITLSIPATLEVKETDPNTDTDAADPNEDAAEPAQAAEPDDAETPTESAVADSVDLESAKDAAQALDVSKEQEPILSLVVEALESAGATLSAERARSRGLEDANLVLTARLDKAEREVRAAAEIVELIASLPLGRKTSFAPIVDGFRRQFSGIYDDVYLQAIEDSNTPER